MPNKDIEVAKKIAKKVSDMNGRTFFVGGYVRDEILGIETKDIDIEVHGIEVDTLVNILESLGGVQKVGASFGVFNLKGYSLDIAMPRKEKSNGRGHKDFEIYVDPFIGYKEACIRRDFTINSLMKDVLTGEIIDHFGGIEDIKNKKIKYVNEISFCEDPLRVFRAAQFASRFEFNIDKKTIELCSTMDVSSLAFERVFEELKKALLKSEKPSIFFNTLKDMNQLSFWFKEIEGLIGIKQSEIHHPEGDVFTHSMMVLDEAAKLRHQAEDKLGFMLAALCHDFGKTITTQVRKGKLTAYGHEVESAKIAKVFLDRLTNKISLKKDVLNLVELHMKPNQMYNTAKKKSMMKLWDDAIHPTDLILLSKADALGRGIKKDYDEIENALRASLKDYNVLMQEPEVSGKDLILLGLKPGVQFSEYIKLGHKLHLSGLSKEEILRHISSDINKKHLV
ncbi:CCA tRNA nucleotidyltransferase [Intestinibacter bartlettii]|uniref:HD domain-containing protein n=1 Tax=Intestinibacter bartlettii TaxID=261299 RepID=A0ABS6DWX2_9FIRM|nr:HD domain-containing protein [Intestinibacter bartlettii]MBU5335746.1 HD domain-containing protein [Intestinibacter bartlettii]